ncbi:MAG: hypothetical protein ACI3XR_09775 [Eubacteriales bacterium]
MAEVRFQKSGGRFYFVFLFAVCMFGMAEFIFFLAEVKKLSDLLFILVFMLLFIGGMIFSICELLINYKAYLRIQGDRLTCRFGFFKKLSCRICEVKSAACKRDTLYLLLINGKQYTVSGILNDDSRSFCFFLRRWIPTSNESPDTIQSEVRRLESLYKKRLLMIIPIFLSAFVMIFLTAILTGWRDAAEFTATDRIVFSAFSVLFAAWTVFLFPYTRQVSKRLVELELRKYDLRWAKAFDFPTDPQIIAIYVSEELNRAVIRRIPGADEGYLTYERFTNGEVETVVSPIVPDYHELMENATSSLWHEIVRTVP